MAGNDDIVTRLQQAAKDAPDGSLLNEAVQRINALTAQTAEIHVHHQAWLNFTNGIAVGLEKNPQAPQLGRIGNVIVHGPSWDGRV